MFKGMNSVPGKQTCALDANRSESFIFKLCNVGGNSSNLDFLTDKGDPYHRAVVNLT